MMHEEAIKVTGVSKSFKLPNEEASGLKQLIVRPFSHDRGYDIQEVLKDISFTVRKGEFFGIVGRNGSGKSTLLKLLSGIYTPNSGTIAVNGTLTPFIELGVGFNPELTGRENIYLNGALLGFSRSDVASMYDDIVSFAELDKFMNQKLKNYSSGMQVRLAFSIAIRANSDILILDEVLAVGDAAFQQKCFDYFNELQRSDKTIILVTHDMSAVQRFCDRALLLKDGRIVEVGKPIDIAESYIAQNVDAVNAAEAKKNKADNRPVPKSSVSAEVIDQTRRHVLLRFHFDKLHVKGNFVSFSLYKDGLPLAELNSSTYVADNPGDAVDYLLDLSGFNAGTYDVSIGGFEADRRQIASSEDRARFVVKGMDMTRGGAVRLEHNWKEPSQE